MTVTLSPELFQTEQFQASFKEKLKSARYWEYDGMQTFTKDELKHYQYGRATKGVLAEFGFYGWLCANNIDFIYDKKVDKRKYSPDIDFILLPSKTRIDVKSGFSYWKKEALLKQSIDYVVVSSPLLDHKSEVYKKGGYTLVESYRRLFKSSIVVDIYGYIGIEDILNQGPTYELFPIEKLIA